MFILMKCVDRDMCLVDKKETREEAEKSLYDDFCKELKNAHGLKEEDSLNNAEIDFYEDDEELCGNDFTLHKDTGWGWFDNWQGNHIDWEIFKV